MKVSKQFTTVTPFSKYLAMALFITIPFITFFVGLKYGEINYQPVANFLPSKTSQQLKNNQTDTSFYKFLSGLSSYTKKTPSISYTCFSTDTVPNTTQFDAIEKNLLTENKIIKTACINPQKDRILVESINKQDGNNSTPRFDLSMYFFYEPDIPTHFNLDYVYKDSADNVHKVFKLDDWTSNNDVIYSIFETSPQYTVITYKYNPTFGEPYSEGKVLFNPILEVCSIRIAMGTSQRLFSYCKTFNESQKSQYINENDIP